MKYSLGLDIGVTSVGWAVIDEEHRRIHDLGVRIFERAENPKNGESLAKPRRDARSARRRLRRRRQRLNALKRFFITHNLLDVQTITKMLSTPNDPYELRVKGLDKRLTNEELFITLYHVAKRRGYKSNRKSQEAKDSEGGRLLQAIAANETLLKAEGYRTAGEALLRNEKYKAHKRNKRDAYTNSFARADFLAEMQAILDAQQKLGLELSENNIKSLLYAQESYELPNNTKTELYYGAFAQRPFMDRDLMQKMIGKCTYEPSEPRAPRASYSFELFRFAQDLVNVVLETKGERRVLITNEVAKAITKAHETRRLTYKTLRKTLALPPKTTFVYLRGKVKNDDPEANAFGEMKFYHDVKKTLSSMDEWQQFVDNPYLLDDIGFILTIEKTDEDIRRELTELALPLPLSPQAVEALLPLSYTKFAAFSTKALRKITPFVLQGQSHDKAVAAAGYTFNHPHRSSNQKLPPLTTDDAERITNPVVKRGISQTIKVINAIVRKYGLPYQIKIECGRELAKNFKERNDIKKRQDENHENNQKIIKLIKEHGILTPNGQQIIKYKLYKQQNGQCLYSGAPISLERLLSDEAAYEIDHIVPWSRCGDDGLGNKALITREENQHKRNAIPYEAFGGDVEKWAAFKARVESLNLGRYKTRRCLAEKVADRDWSAHALKDTQYITRFLKEYVEKNLAFSDPEKKQRVLLPAGNITSYLGKRWGLSKDRELNVLHHARDAALVAVITQGLIHRVAQYNKYGEIMKYHRFTKALKAADGVVDFETGEIMDEAAYSILKEEAFDRTDNTDHHFPRPWPRFDDEVRRRTADISVDQLRNELENFENYDPDFLQQVHPIFVSRMPNRKVAGSAHEETLRSPKININKMRTVRVPLTNIKLKDLDNAPAKDSDAQLYQTLRRRLEEYNDKPERAFAEPVYKQDKRGANVHQVRTIKVASKKLSGFEINGKTAFVDNGDVARLDVYQKDGKFFCTPVYVWQLTISHNKNPKLRNSKNAEVERKIRKANNIDGSFYLVCSLYKNDYVIIRKGHNNIHGYYRSYNPNGGRIKLLPHLAASNDNLIEVSGVKTMATAVERFDISVLGDNIPRI